MTNQEAFCRMDIARWIARVSTTLGPTVHYEGPPPGVLEGLERVQMPEASWVILQASEEGVFLIRYSESGEFAGDTWSPSREIALSVAAEEYGLTEEDWIAVPDDVPDPIVFARTAAKGRVQ